MENPSKTVSIGLIALVIGLGGGYLVASRHAPEPAMAPMMSGMNMDHGSMPMATSSAMDMSGMMADMNAALRGKTGADFDKAFLDEMIVHHQGAVDMAKLVLTSSQRPELKTFANEIITAQSREIGQMQAWKGTWFK